MAKNNCRLQITKFCGYVIGRARELATKQLL